MNLDLLLDNLLSPPILFFALGMLACWVKSELTIPEAISQLFSLYLLWAIGFKGGVELRNSGLEVSALSLLGAAVVASAAWPLVVYPILRRKFNRADAAATAAAYGSVSAVTFITACNFLESRAIPYGGSLVAALALMEFPAIMTGVILYRARTMKAAGKVVTGGLGELAREALLGGPVFLLVGSMVVGLLTGPEGGAKLKPFTDDVFQGVLVLFLLDSGMRAAGRLKESGGASPFAVFAGLLLPLFGAAVGLGISTLLGAAPGDGFLMMILTASASYIAVPAAMRLAIPEANAGVYLPMALAVTFPFNIAARIPLYLLLANAALGGGAVGVPV